MPLQSQEIDQITEMLESVVALIYLKQLPMKYSSKCRFQQDHKLHIRMLAS